MNVRLLVFLVTICGALEAVAGELKTTLTKKDADNWFVTYEISEPAEKLVFKRNPDQSRVHRWTPVLSDFIIEADNGVELVRRRDGNAFTRVVIRLTPTYTYLRMDYAPFSPFSDGSMLLHSGRFFACVKKCDDHVNRWSFKLVSHQQEKIIVDGKVSLQTAEWTDANSGRMLFVGDYSPSEDTNFFSVMDQGLPLALKEMMQSQLPGLMTYFSKHLNPPETKPAFFASYSPTSDGRFGRQGGVLPGQVFMHWYGIQSIQAIDSEQIITFFAHEVAHIFQLRGAFVEAPEEAWVHEGGAELFAGMAVNHIRGDTNSLNDKLSQARQQCLHGLKDNVRFRVASDSNPQLHYSCGMVIMNAIRTRLKEADKDIAFFRLWKRFDEEVSSGESASAESFVGIAAPMLPDGFSLMLNQFTRDEDFDSYRFIQDLIETND